MRSSNPVLSRSDVFSRNGYAPPQPAPAPAPAPGGIDYRKPTPYGDQPPPASTRAMTIDDVVSKTGLLLGVAVVTGALAWAADVGYGLAILAALVGFGLAMVNSFKRVPSPPLIIAYAAVEGVFLGAISHAINSRPGMEGVVVQAVAGTAIVFAIMLALYKSGRLRATPRFTRILIGATLGYFVLMLGNLVLNIFNSGANAWGGGFGLLTAAAGVVLASLFLVLDFDMIEDGIRMGAPESESWRAAFGLTVTIVWLYFEMLRLLSILRGD
ncbi:MAG: Bax inhibitor-1/YccA family protein [Sporichthyaceae bacterium]